MAYEIVEEIVPREREGFGGGAQKDDSGDLADMKYAERLVLDKEFLTSLSTLKPVTKVKKTIEGRGEVEVKVGGFLRLSKEDILKVREGKDIEMNGVAHKVNQVFVALEIPFYAESYATDSAEKVQHTAKTGKRAGKTSNRTIADKLQIYRTSVEFDIDNYAAAKSKRVLEEGVNDYMEPTPGMRDREDKWVEENAAQLAGIFKLIGIDITFED